MKRFLLCKCPWLSRNSAETLLSTDLTVLSWSIHLCTGILPDNWLRVFTKCLIYISLTEKLTRTLLKLQESIVGLALINCYLSLSTQTLKMLEVFIICAHLLLSLFKYVLHMPWQFMSYILGLGSPPTLSPCLAKWLNKIKSHRNNFLKIFSSLTQLLTSAWKSVPSVISNFRVFPFQGGYFCKMAGMDWSGTGSLPT